MSTDSTWSSEKIKDITDAKVEIDDINVSNDTTYSSQKIETTIMSMPLIDDTQVLEDKTWSSSRIDSRFETANTAITRLDVRQSTLEQMTFQRVTLNAGKYCNISGFSGMFAAVRNGNGVIGFTSDFSDSTRITYLKNDYSNVTATYTGTKTDATNTLLLKIRNNTSSAINLFFVSYYPVSVDNNASS